MKFKKIMHLFELFVLTEWGNSVILVDEYGSNYEVERVDIEAGDNFAGFNRILRLIYGIFISRGYI